MIYLYGMGILHVQKCPKIPLISLKGLSKIVVYDFVFNNLGLDPTI